MQLPVKKKKKKKKSKTRTRWQKLYRKRNDLERGRGECGDRRVGVEGGTEISK